MDGEPLGLLVEPDCVSQTVDIEYALMRAIRHAVIVAADRHESFMADAPLKMNNTVEPGRGQRLSSHAPC